MKHLTKPLGLPLLAISTLMSLPAAAHDFWLQPEDYNLPAGEPAAVTVEIGHGADRSSWYGRLERVVALRSFGPEGIEDHLDSVSAWQNQEPAETPLTASGTHVMTLETTHANSTLGAEKFNAYLEEEGLIPAMISRVQNKETDQPGTEIYSRRSKALIQTGPYEAGQSGYVVSPLGLTLEIVTEQNPYGLTGDEPLPIQVFYLGKPLPGATVKLRRLDQDTDIHATQKTDESGRTVFEFPKSGDWLLTTVWTRPLEEGSAADFDTTFSSLSFGYAAE